MGIYLAAPNKEKHSFEDQYGKMKYGASGMQGLYLHFGPPSLIINRLESQYGGQSYFKV